MAAGIAAFQAAEEAKELAEQKLLNAKVESDKAIQRAKAAGAKVVGHAGTKC